MILLRGGDQTSSKRMQRTAEHLSNVYADSRALIKKTLYKKAYIMLDKFNLAQNENNCLSIFDRVVITKRLIYCLNKILERLYTKANGQIDKFDRKKGEEIIQRLGILIYKQYAQLSFILDNQNEEAVYFISQQQHIPYSQLYRNADVQVRTSINIMKEVCNYYYSVLYYSKLLFLWHKNLNMPRLAFEYISFCYLLSQKIVLLPHGNSRKIIVQATSILLLFCNFQEECWNHLEAQVIINGGEELILQQCLLIFKGLCEPQPYFNRDQEIAHTQLTKKRLRKCCKYAMWTLLTQAYYLEGQFQYSKAMERLRLTEWLANGLITTYNDEIKNFCLNICLQFAPKFQDEVFLLQDVEDLLRKHFSENFYIFQKQQLAVENAHQAEEEKNRISNRIQEKIYEKNQQSELNQQGFIFLKTQNQTSSAKQQIETDWKLKKKFESLNLDMLTTLDQISISGYDTKRSSVQTSPRKESFRSSRLKSESKEFIVKRPTKILTTQKCKGALKFYYFRFLILKPKQGKFVAVAEAREPWARWPESSWGIVTRHHFLKYDSRECEEEAAGKAKDLGGQRVS